MSGPQNPVLDAAREEVEITHRFFVRWFTGVAAPLELQAFADRLHPDVQFIGPNGSIIDRVGLLAMFEGRHGSNPGFAIDISDVILAHDLGDHIVVTYIEWQRGAKATRPADNARQTSVLFARDPEGELTWRHIHETGLPASGTAD